MADTGGTNCNEPRPSHTGGLGAAIPQWSIENPYVVIAFYTAIVLLAIGAIFFIMPRRMMPYVESPLVGVVSMMPGYSAQEMETYFSNPIEQRMVDIKNLRFIRSTSQDGFSIVTLEFNYGIDMKKALFDVQSLMNVVQGDLPMTGANLKPSWVLPIDPLNIPVLALSMTGDGWDPIKLRQLADNQIINELKTVPNVQSVVPFGGQKRQIQVVVDRTKLASYELSILDVRNAIDANNVSRSAGTLTSGSDEAIVRANARAQSAEDIAGYPIGDFGGSPVYVKDVAQVDDTAREQRSGYHFNGKPSIEVSIVQQPEASSPRVISGVMDKLKDIEQRYPGVHFETAYDNSHFVSLLMKNMGEELILAILLTGLVVLLFLGEWRATLISLTTIPISLGMALLMLIAFGMTLNSSTLIGLLLSIGRLVDDSIIDIHSVQRHLAMGKSPKQAAIDGISEVRLAVMAATFILILALMPLVFAGGLVQLMFVGIVWPIIFGLLASLLVSFTLTALMAANILKPHSAVAGHGFLQTRILDPSQRVLERVENNYRHGLRWSLGNRQIVIAIAIATIAIGWAMYPLLGSEMMPLADVGQAYGVMEATPGTSYQRTEQLASQVERILLKQPEVERVSTEIGFEAGGTYFTGYSMGFVNSASFMVTLKDKDERETGRDIWQVIDSVQRQALRSVPGLRRLAFKEMGADVMASSAAPIQLAVYGTDLQRLSRLGNQVKRIADENPDIHQASTSWSMQLPEYDIDVDRARAQQLGLSVQEVTDQAYYSLRGGLTSEFFRLPNIRQNTILVRYDQQDRGYSGDLEQVMITGKNGEQVPLKSIATISRTVGPTLIEHDNLRRTVSVLGYYRKDGPGSMELTMDTMDKALMTLPFPPGYGIDMRGDMTQMEESFGRLLNGLKLAVIFIFLILVAQFRGFTQPFNMILSLPLELTGIFAALLLAGQTFSTVSILAIVILTGMDITVAVLIIDMIIRLREQGMSRDEAIMTAGPIRLRPILMTSLITIAALSPVAFFPKAGIDAYSPLATVVIGGLTVGTVLSLFVVPVLHTYVDDATVWLGRRLRSHREPS